MNENKKKIKYSINLQWGGREREGEKINRWEKRRK